MRLRCPLRSWCHQVHGFGEWFRWKTPPLLKQTRHDYWSMPVWWSTASGNQLGRSPETLDGILHPRTHRPHAGPQGTLQELDVPVYCNRLTADELRFRVETPLDIRQFVTGEPFEIGDMQIENFSVPHDAQDPVGFHIRTPDGSVGILTDIGQTTRLVLERVRGANALFIEANYDLNRLQEDTRRPWAIKQRIMSQVRPPLKRGCRRGNRRPGQRHAAKRRSGPLEQRLQHPGDCTEPCRRGAWPSGHQRHRHHRLNSGRTHRDNHPLASAWPSAA